MRLEEVTAEERKGDEDRRAIIRAIKQKIDERIELTEGHISQARAILETQKKEIKKLRVALDGQNERIETMQAQMMTTLK